MTSSLGAFLDVWFTAYVEHAVNTATPGASKEMPEILLVKGDQS